MIKRQTKGDELHLTFVLPVDEPQGAVSVVGDFNDWQPGAHTLVRRSNGTRSVRVTVERGASYRFRYLGEDGRWFDDPAADVRDREDGVVLT
jgi:1,4-alpha-glucan branching enzyme